MSIKRTADAITGAIYGVLVGGLIGLGVCIWIIVDPPFFTGDTIVIGAIVCGLLGFFVGEPFLDRMQENWHRIV